MRINRPLLSLAAALPMGAADPFCPKQCRSTVTQTSTLTRTSPHTSTVTHTTTRTISLPPPVVPTKTVTATTFVTPPASTLTLTAPTASAQTVTATTTVTSALPASTSKIVAVYNSCPQEIQFIGNLYPTLESYKNGQSISEGHFLTPYSITHFDYSKDYLYGFLATVSNYGSGGPYSDICVVLMDENYSVCNQGDGAQYVGDYGDSRTFILACQLLA